MKTAKIICNFIQHFLAFGLATALIVGSDHHSIMQVLRVQLATMTISVVFGLCWTVIKVTEE